MLMVSIPTTSTTGSNAPCDATNTLRTSGMKTKHTMCGHKVCTAKRRCAARRTYTQHSPTMQASAGCRYAAQYADTYHRSGLPVYALLHPVCSTWSYTRQVLAVSIRTSDTQPKQHAARSADTHRLEQRYRPRLESYQGTVSTRALVYIPRLWHLG